MLGERYQLLFETQKSTARANGCTSAAMGTPFFMIIELLLDVLGFRVVTPRAL